MPLINIGYLRILTKYLEFFTKLYSNYSIIIRFMNLVHIQLNFNENHYYTPQIHFITPPKSEKLFKLLISLSTFPKWSNHPLLLPH